jgi:hypothetical protein
LTPEQQEQLRVQSRTGTFRSVWEVLAWVEATWGVRYCYWGCGGSSGGLLSARKSPGPRRPKPIPPRKRRGERGLASVLTQAGLTTEGAIEWEDELWIGLTGSVRRVWAPRGEGVRQRVDTSKEAQQLALRVNPRTGAVHWQWLADLKTATFVQLVQEWAAAGIAGVVWDGGGAHTSNAVREAGQAQQLVLVHQPAHAPELNPVERLIQELRRRVEGLAYRQLSRKKAAVEAALTELAADPARVRRLVGWEWIATALGKLPAAELTPVQ